MGVGAVSGALSSGIGQAYGGIGDFSKELSRAFTHGIVQANISAFTGGDVGSAFLSSVISSGVGSGTNGLSKAGQLGVSALSGAGLSTAMNGGNFWENLAYSSVVVGLNHLMDKVEEESVFFHRLRKHYEEKTGEDFILSKKEFRYIVNEAIKNKAINYKNAIKGESGEYKALVDFYDVSVDLALSFGRATVGYVLSNKGHAEFKSFFDKYDFDPKPYWGNKQSRSWYNELLTRGYNIYSSGKAFNIIYQSKSK